MVRLWEGAHAARRRNRTRSSPGIGESKARGRPTADLAEPSTSGSTIGPTNSATSPPPDNAKKALVEERTLYLVAFLREHPCVDCGEDDPVVLEFDHLRDKKFSISAGIQGRRWQDVLDEIAKCEVVCANCHRRRTAKRGGFLRAAVAQR